MRQGLGLSRRMVAAGIFAGLGLGAAACGEVSTDPDAADEESEYDASGQAGGDDAGAPPDATGAECDDGFTGPDCEECTVFVGGDEGSNGNQGLSWDDAVASVNAGIGRAATRLDNDGLERCAVWVREGTYVPGDSRDDSFELASGVHVFGGFAGFEGAREDRNFQQYETTLSGDINASGDLDGNAYHVVTATNIGPDDATLDGFTITGGNADGSGDDRHGGGMVNDDASPALENVVFTENSAQSGGAMYNLGDSAPTVANAVFTENQAESAGGAMFNTDNSAPTLTNVTFVENIAEGSGGAMRNSSATTPTLTNVAFSENHAETGGAMANGGDSAPILVNVLLNKNSVEDPFDGFSTGGGIYNSQRSEPVLVNVTFVGNTVNEGGGAAIHSAGSVLGDHEVELELVNVILWGNEANEGDNNEILHNSNRPLIVRSSIVEGGEDRIAFPNDGGLDAGDGDVLDEDPKFVEPPEDLRLGEDSEAIGAGDLEVFDDPNLDLPDTDLAGNPRVVGDDIDLGAYEYQAE